MPKRYAPEIAEHMRGYRPEKWTTATEKIPNNGGTHRLDYEIECLYEHKNKPHGKTTSRVPLLRCPHCGSPKIRTTIKRVPVNGIKYIESEPDPERPSEAWNHEQKPMPEIPSPDLTMMEIRILRLLEAQPVVTKEDLRERIWNGSVNTSTIYAAVGRLRAKILRQIVLDRDAGGYRLENHHEK